MKLLKKNVERTVRVMISGKDQKSKSFTLHDASVDEVNSFLIEKIEETENA